MNNISMDRNDKTLRYYCRKVAGNGRRFNQPDPSLSAFFMERHNE
ncbi:hypothetical protein LCGC14_1031940 [marine sediment metagenome]|uniref:Uncharacterized protein n=1 Tax=marine sediment metagenome TaxID=412755 RepID=A0A0F9MYW9_9ZZZZ